MRGIITNIQRFSIHDGPGVRTTVFFKGCPLRCLWCHNPETYAFGAELRYKRSACIGCGSCISACARGALTRDGEGLSRDAARGDGLSYDAARCDGCGACARACPGGGIAFTGRSVTVAEVLAEALADAGMYARTGGGVTLSGGEATAQPDFALALLGALRERGIHTALDTCGHCEPARFKALAGASDLILFDLKHLSDARHRELTGVGNRLILENFAALSALPVPVEVRVPIVPGLNDDDDNLAATARAVRAQGRVSRIVLLGYHAIGLSKIVNFNQTGADLGVKPPPAERLKALAARMADASGAETIYR